MVLLFVEPLPVLPWLNVLHDQLNRSSSCCSRVTRHVSTIMQQQNKMDVLCSAALSELDQFDKMINWMLVTYFGCLALGWGLLLFDWVWNKVHKLHSQVELCAVSPVPRIGFNRYHIGIAGMVYYHKHAVAVADCCTS